MKLTLIEAGAGPPEIPLITNNHSVDEHESGRPVLVFQPPLALIVKDARAVDASTSVKITAKPTDLASTAAGRRCLQFTDTIQNDFLLRKMSTSACARTSEG